MRIAVNQEILNLGEFLEGCPRNFMETKLSKKRTKVSKSDQLPLESLLMIITFHSLEERLVSQAMAKWRKAKLGDVATKKPVSPSGIELEENSRSKSAKLFSFIFEY